MSSFFIACPQGRVLTFDPGSEKFVNDPEADNMLTRNYREGYQVPAQSCSPEQGRVTCRAICV